MQLVSVGGVPAKTMLGAIGTSVLWSDQSMPESGATFLGQIRYASIHDGALSDHQLQRLLDSYAANTATCGSAFHSHGANATTRVSCSTP